MFAQVSPVLNVNKCSRSFQVLQVNVLKDPEYGNESENIQGWSCLALPGVDDDVVLHIVNIQAAVDHLSLSDGHPVVVHLVEGEVSVSVQSLPTPS